MTQNRAIKNKSGHFEEGIILLFSKNILRMLHGGILIFEWIRRSKKKSADLKQNVSAEPSSLSNLKDKIDFNEATYSAEHSLHGTDLISGSSMSHALLFWVP